MDLTDTNYHVTNLALLRCKSNFPQVSHAASVSSGGSGWLATVGAQTDRATRVLVVETNKKSFLAVLTSVSAQVVDSPLFTQTARSTLVWAQSHIVREQVFRLSLQLLGPSSHGLHIILSIHRLLHHTPGTLIPRDPRLKDRTLLQPLGLKHLDHGFLIPRIPIPGTQPHRHPRPKNLSTPSLLVPKRNRLITHIILSIK